ncbi:hypothetical protein [uncultured Microbacterium sp.]|uniref:Uncharacterized protein n=1 Tax=uncultured Microbacterium sp. TaxID=191216 RepID=A0A1Y5NXW0_9MICO|nr:hypothetical protein [uncultured Microbacterium sp.]SBS69949.1 hypothetical protein MIPYR_10130 [uncultured Microbacterium sp.]
MTATAMDVVRGAAVVIDDRIGQESDIDDLLKQLDDEAIPTVKLKRLPPPESLVHWKQFALIVMDWALTDVDDESEIEIPAGVPVPSTLSREIIDRNIAFIAALLEQTALPVFIATNESLDEVRTSLREGLETDFPVYNERVHVFSKSELKPDLFETIGSWVSSRPALTVLNAWRTAYVDAEINVFHQFSRAQHDWVASIQRAAAADDAELPVMMRDLIAANVLNRIGPLKVILGDVAPDGALDDASSLRRVLHYSAVVPDSSLATSEASTGDLFVVDGASEPFERIRILLTPECDLTLRDKTWRFTTLTAVRNPRASKQSKNRAAEAWKLSRSRDLFLTVNLLTEDCAEYDIAVNEWTSEAVTPTKTPDEFVIWPGHKRIGRLLPPYSSFLQQSFASVAIRKGMPRLPADLYAAAVAEAE